MQQEAHRRLPQSRKLHARALPNARHRRDGDGALLRHQLLVDRAAQPHGHHPEGNAGRLWRAARSRPACELGREAQSGLAPENLTTFPHFSVSSATSFPKSAGEPASSEAPRSASLAFALGSARIALISLLSLSMMSSGVAFGTPTPYQALAS